MLNYTNNSDPETKDNGHYTMIVQLQKSLRFVSLKSKTDILSEPA